MQREGLDTRMSKIAIVTDSNSGITQKQAQELGVFVLAMPFQIDGETYYEDITLTQEEFYKKLREGGNISTSQPSPGSVTDLWDKILQEYDQIVHIPMSSGLSGSCQTAIMLAQEEEYDGKVYVVNNQRISVTQRQSVIDAKSMAEAGYDAAAIQKRLEETKFDSTIYITLDTLHYLKKGGRITPAAAALGTILRLKPVLQIQGEKLDAFTKVRGMKKAELKMLEAIEEDLNTRFADVDRKQLRLGAAGTFQKQEDADQWYKMVKDTFENEIDDIYYDSLSFSIGCHVGPNAIGIGISVVTRDEK
mgnify:CR=1 FL=1